LFGGGIKALAGNKRSNMPMAHRFCFTASVSVGTNARALTYARGCVQEIAGGRGAAFRTALPFSLARAQHLPRIPGKTSSWTATLRRYVHACAWLPGAYTRRNVARAVKTIALAGTRKQMDCRWIAMVNVLRIIQATSIRVDDGRPARAAKA